MPESGETKGLLLALDAHSDLVTPSSVTEAYRVFQLCAVYHLGYNNNHQLMQGFKTIIDTKNEYPITSRGPILIKPGQVVRKLVFKNMFLGMSMSYCHSECGQPGSN